MRYEFSDCPTRAVNEEICSSGSLSAWRSAAEREHSSTWNIIASNELQMKLSGVSSGRRARIVTCWSRRAEQREKGANNRRRCAIAQMCKQLISQSLQFSQFPLAACFRSAAFRQLTPLLLLTARSSSSGSARFDVAPLCTIAHEADM